MNGNNSINKGKRLLGGLFLGGLFLGGLFLGGLFLGGLFLGGQGEPARRKITNSLLISVFVAGVQRRRRRKKGLTRH